MADLPNRSDLMAVGRRYLLSRQNTRLNAALVDVEGTDLNLFIGSSSVMGENIVAAFARCMRGVFFDSARGDQLDRLAADRLGLTRKSANAATVDLVLARPTFAGGGGTLAAGSRVQTPSGTGFFLNVDVTFSGASLAQPVSATALIVGPEGNVPEGAITSFLDQPFDATIVPSNAAPAAGGTNDESDSQFKGRIRGFYATLRRGVIGAIEFAATLVPGVVVAKAYEVANPGTALPAAAVELIIGDANGNATSPMIQAVKDILVQFRSCGIPVFVSSGLVVLEPVTWLLAYQTGIDTVQAREDVRAVTVAITQFLAPGAPLRRADLIAAARTVPGVIIGDASLVAPAGDVFPEDNTHLIRVTPPIITFA